MSEVFAPGPAWAQQLLAWWDSGHRDLPWRRTRDPYAIWISEVMLQQTRVAVVLPYYAAFMQRFPTVQALAAAPEQDLLSQWAGLGYYSRARNLQRAAQAIGDRPFPAAYDDILQLPGIGEYTAAAVASIAFNVPRAAVDGNVLRVLARASADDGDIRTLPVRRRLAQLAGNLLHPERAGDYNQAMMELGATTCLPRAPQCLLCPVRDLCRANAQGGQEDYPVSTKRAEITRLARVLWVVRRDGQVLLWQRPATDSRMPGFWELPEREHLRNHPRGETAGVFRHSITRFEYTFEVRTVTARTSFGGCKEGIATTWVQPAQLGGTPVSTVARKALRIAGEL